VVGWSYRVRRLVMGRELRRVAKDWQHPVDESGGYLPLFDGAKFELEASAWDEEAQKWAEGFRRSLFGKWIALTEREKEKSYLAWAGERPDAKDYMPLWRDDERTHIMMYEDTTNGTPISPAFKSREELARWLADNNASCFDEETASFDVWLKIMDDSANSMARFSTPSR
jgi:hypothetical protein